MGTIPQSPPNFKEALLIVTHCEEMKHYIDRTPIENRDRYDMRMRDLNTLRDLFSKDPFRAISLAFAFGRAKGYRAAKAR